MKLLDKLKNALFEEEYVEVEEKPKAPKKEKPIAKKIVLPEQKKETKQAFLAEEEEVEEIIEEPKKDFKFPAILEDDFIEMEEPKKEEKKEEPPKREEKKEVPVYSYQEEKPKKENTLYGNNRKNEVNLDIPSYGSSYEKKQEKKTFRPSPIISPIYGVIDENQSTVEPEPKREIRISSSYSSRKLDVDAVRAKAYGDTDDIFEEELKPSDTKVIVEEEEESNEEDAGLLMDIANTSPTVSKVTVGDAEEYFQDLGLEYNIDYKDASHERATGRRVDFKKEDPMEEPKEAGLEDNLFELIDSMYEEKEGE